MHACMYMHQVTRYHTFFIPGLVSQGEEPSRLVEIVFASEMKQLWVIISDGPS